MGSGRRTRLLATDFRSCLSGPGTEDECGRVWRKERINTVLLSFVPPFAKEGSGMR